MCSSRPPLVLGQGWLIFPGSSQWQSLCGLWALLHSILHVTHLVVGKEIHFYVVQRYSRVNHQGAHGSVTALCMAVGLVQAWPCSMSPLRCPYNLGPKVLGTPQPACEVHRAGPG